MNSQDNYFIFCLLFFYENCEAWNSQTNCVVIQFWPLVKLVYRALFSLRKVSPATSNTIVDQAKIKKERTELTEFDKEKIVLGLVKFFLSLIYII